MDASRRLTLPAVVVTVCLLIVTSAAALATSRSLDRREDQLLDERAEAAAAVIDRRTDTYTEKLIGLRGVFAASPDGIPSPRAYDSALRSQEIMTRIPELQTVSFVQYVRGRDLGAYLRRMRRETAASGLPYPPVRLDPPGRRAAYALVSYVHPVQRNTNAVGADLLVDLVRRGAINRARDSARPHTPAPVRLIQQPDALSVVLYMPVYAGPDQTPPVGERSDRFVGMVATGVRLTDLARGVTARPDDHVQIFDFGYRDARRLRRLIFSSEEQATEAESRSRELPLDMHGRRWSIVYSSTRPLVGAMERAVPWLIGVLGLVVSLLAGAVMNSATSGRRQALADLEASRNELARSNEELERFAFLASHDLQQPLRTVSGFLELLERQQGDRLDERGHQYVDMALRGTKQMSALITDLLTYSRVARDDRPLEPVSLSDAWDAAVGQLKATLDEAQADVERADLPVVDSDRGQMTQLFANLIINAVKYRSEERPRIRADAMRVNGGWEVTVADNGVGIDPRDQELIFEMFRRLHTEDQVEGTGVGLALVKRIAERSGGDVRVESARGEGSRFVLTLPAQERHGAR
jgi:signal transduction histidine kinase